MIIISRCCIIFVMDKLTDKNTKVPPTFKKTMIELVVWSVVFRVSQFLTIYSMFMLGIITVPFAVLGIVGQLRAAADVSIGWKTYDKKQRNISIALIVYCFISMLVGVVYFTLLFAGNLCLINCSASENQINTILLLIFLFL